MHGKMSARHGIAQEQICKIAAENVDAPASVAERSRPAPPVDSVGRQNAYFFGFISTSPPASRHSVKPPARCDTFSSPISMAVRAESAERQPLAQ